MKCTAQQACTASMCVPTCAGYCASIASSCTGTMPTTNGQYASAAQCAKFCGYFAHGAANANTLECRVANLALVGTDATNCRAAGPYGLANAAMMNACGTSNCDAFCQLARAICPTDHAEDQATCVTQCTGYTSDPSTLDIPNSSPSAGNTLECREYHLSAALTDPTLHCPHTTQGSTICL
jgi:hypothetical protein